MLLSVIMLCSLTVAAAQQLRINIEYKRTFYNVSINVIITLQYVAFLMHTVPLD